MTVLVTDSSALLTREEAREWGVRVVPLFYAVAGRPFLETYSGENGDYLSLLAKGQHAQTSQPAPGAYLSVFDEITRQGNEVLCLTLSSRLSGAYGSAMAAAKELPDRNITVFDARTSGGGLYMMVQQAAALAKKQLSTAEIADRLYALRDTVSVAFSVADLTPLHQGGRLGRVRQSINTILNNHPLFLCQDGTIVSDGMARGKTAQQDYLFSKVPPGASHVIVHHAGKESRGALELASRLRAAHPTAKVSVRVLGPVLTVHLGFSALCVVWM
jgi:DegV family protein with EDD domain